MYEVIKLWSVGVFVLICAIFASLFLWERYGELAGRLVHLGSHVFEEAAETASKLLATLMALGFVIAVCMGCYALGAAVLKVFA